MSETPTPNIALEKPTPGTEIGTWGPIANSNYDIIDSYIGGSVPNPFSIPFTGNPIFSGIPVFSNDPNFSGNPTFSGNPVFTGTPSFTGLTLSSIDTSTIFADQMAGADASAKIQTAIVSLPPAGGTVNAINLSDSGGTGSVTIDPGSKAVTILLGPYTYNFTQIALRTGLKIIGSSDGLTFIQSVGPNGTPLFVSPTTGSPAQRVCLKFFQAFGASGNSSQEGLFCDASAGAGGLWYSIFEQVCFQQFKGPSIHLKGTRADYSGLNQFLTFINCQAFRDLSATNIGLKIEGANGALKFINCEFDGPSSGGSTTGNNIYIGVVTAADAAIPFSIIFDLLTCQAADIGVVLNGCVHVAFRDPHHELLNGGYQFNNGGVNKNVLIEHAYFADNVGVDGGLGFLLDGTSGGATTTVTLRNSVWAPFGTPPDNITLGNYALSSHDNEGLPSLGAGFNFYKFANFAGQSIDTVNVQAVGGNFQTAGNITLGAGWGTSAAVSAVLGASQTESFVITSGSGAFGAAPTVTVIFPDIFVITPLCTLTVTDITGSGGAIMFAMTSSNTAQAVFTAKTSTGAAYTPAASQTYKVILRVGP